MEWTFTGSMIEWRGPAPFYFVPLPDEDADDVKEAARDIVYWGQVPVTATIGATTFTTALFPKDGTYLLPVKDVVRHAEDVDLDDVVSVTLRVGRQT